MRKLSEIIKPRTRVHFQFYRNGELWYRTDTDFEFPVPITDTGDAVFLWQDKAILFMRWIRKHLSAIETAREESC